MNKFIFPAILCAATLVTQPANAGKLPDNPYLSTAAVSSVLSAASSVIISAVILSPVILPAQLSVESVENNKKEKVTTITGKTDKNEDVVLLVATEKLEKIPVNPGDKLAMEPAEKGPGAYLKKDGKIITHMVNQDDRELTHQEKMP
ncbi:MULTISPECIES: STM0539 family protein [Morganella]|uniref:STM0539 family protein n=1 Tax=Morganella morganii TaxID=582 RepID=A0AAN5MBE4_MORMO|nr:MULTISPECIES: STM0539 family protein [Morganella]MCU6212782.1 STM0539 family protein [Morganella morganii]MCU6226392.1 STM0539 family protein [Morganella morganii]MCU6235257.1 STM0539 family protein [Morganella morganii]MCU6237937.1 STM0539 family protein [Morganella morganii]MCU6272326.1 STM0539 family protein [Morganella morganii]